MGYVPARNPALVILVAMDEPSVKKQHYYGGDVAAPVFREIASQSFSYMGLLPERRKPPVGYGPGRVVKASVERSLNVAGGSSAPSTGATGAAGLVPDLSGLTMRDVLRATRGMPVEVAFEGSGRVVSQRPRAGSRLPGDGVVKVAFR
jgi:cell division protein FtsI (penicillin-binding protein 3)